MILRFDIFTFVRCECPEFLGPASLSLILKNFLGDLATLLKVKANYATPGGVWWGHGNKLLSEEKLHGKILHF